MSDQPLSGYSFVVAQATGMVSVQARCSVQEALTLIRQRADRYPSESVETIAAAVVDRVVRFDAMT